MQDNKMMLEVKTDNIKIYELESNEAFDYDNLPEDKRKEIDAKNEKYERKELQEALRMKAAPCQCMAPVLQERAIRRASLLASTGPAMQVQIQITQEDIDQKDFCVILNEDDGIYTDIRCIISHCKRCGEMHIWGDLDPIADMVAFRFVDYDTTQQKKKQREEAAKRLIEDGPTPPPGVPQFMLENAETGEMTPADDFVRAMAGQGPLPADMNMETLNDDAPTDEEEKPSLILPD